MAKYLSWEQGETNSVRSRLHFKVLSLDSLSWDLGLLCIVPDVINISTEQDPAK